MRSKIEAVKQQKGWTNQPPAPAPWLTSDRPAAEPPHTASERVHSRIWVDQDLDGDSADGVERTEDVEGRCGTETEDGLPFVQDYESLQQNQRQKHISTTEQCWESSTSTWTSSKFSSQSLKWTSSTFIFIFFKYVAASYYPQNTGISHCTHRNTQKHTEIHRNTVRSVHLHPKYERVHWTIVHELVQAQHCKRAAGENEDWKPGMKQEVNSAKYRCETGVNTRKIQMWNRK